MSEENPRPAVAQYDLVGPASDDILLADPEARRRLTEPPPEDERSDPDNTAHEYQRTDQ